MELVKVDEMEEAASAIPRDLQRRSRLVPAFKKLTIRDTVAVIDLLKDHCRSLEGTAVYALGWDDKTVAEAVGTETATENGVSRVRRELYGHLRVSMPNALTNVQRLERLERLVAKMCQELGFADDEPEGEES